MNKYQDLEWHDGGLVEVAELPNGDLIIVLTSDGWFYQDEIKQIRNMRGINPALGELFSSSAYGGLLGNGWSFDTVDRWGNMSDAPALSNNMVEVFDDENLLFEMALSFWYSDNYMIIDEIEEIYKRGFLIWKKFVAREE